MRTQSREPLKAVTFPSVHWKIEKLREAKAGAWNRMRVSRSCVRFGGKDVVGEVKGVEVMDVLLAGGGARDFKKLTVFKAHQPSVCTQFRAHLEGREVYLVMMCYILVMARIGSISDHLCHNTLI